MNGAYFQLRDLLRDTAESESARAHDVAQYCLRRFAGDVLVLSAPNKILVALSDVADEFGRSVTRRPSVRERYCLLVSSTACVGDVLACARHVNGLIWLTSAAGSLSSETLLAAGIPMLGWDAPLIVSSREAFLARRDLP